MDEPVKIFYLDDDANYRKLVVRILDGKKNGFNVVEADSLEDFREYLLRDEFDLVISDLDVRWDTGLQVIDFVQAHRPLLPVIIITDSRSEELAVEAMKRGAADYIFKSSNHIKMLPKSIRSAINKKKLDNIQRKTHQLLKKSEENYRTIFENCPDGILVTDHHGRIFDVNKATCAMLGRTVDQIRGLGMNAFVDEMCSWLADLSKNGVNFGGFKGKLNLKRSDGSTYPVEFDSRIFKDRLEGAKVITVFRDVCEHARSNREEDALATSFLHSQRMEAVGTLITGMAHDFNNMFQVILSAAQSLMMGKDENDPDYADLEQIAKTVHDGADLINQLLIFAKKGEFQRVPTKLNDLIIAVSGILIHTFPPTIDVQLNLDPQLATVSLDPNQIRRLIVNLSVNAKEAMPNGGQLKIESANVHLDSEYCRRYNGVTPGNFVMLSFADTGPGIDKQMQTKIFEPFFSSKQRSSEIGTGLGLSVVQGIVEQHDGYMECESELGSGAKFRIFFPVN